MKIKVDIVTGFIGSGKTKFINNKIRTEVFRKNIIVIIQCEKGQSEIDYDIFKNNNLFIENVSNQNSLDEKYLNEIIKKYQPNKIIIEANGIEKIDNLLNIFDYFSVSRKCFINEIVHLIDATTFDIFMNNMGEILITQISNSDFIILKNTAGFDIGKLNSIKRTLKRINRSAKISREILIQNKPKIINNEILILMAVFLSAVTYLVCSVIGFEMPAVFFPWIEHFSSVFLSILIQAFPFILFGVFVSSVIQVFVTSEKIIRIFPKNRILQFIVAIFAGAFFPVCDCAIVPVAARLIKKGVPLPAAVTFMLAAPIVNPIVIASTLYAFPGQPSIAIYRFCIGILVALFVGIVFVFSPEKDIMLLSNVNEIACDCGLCGDNYDNKKGFGRNIDAVFRHATTEFFTVGKFLIIGSFLSSLMQTIIPKDVFSNLGRGSIISLLIMMLFAFILSVCSTSDAFIARSFTNQFSMGSVMGFLVLGPMIDIKNLLMLLGSFQKRFVIKLVILIFVISFEILLVFTTLF
ncbi:permease [Clostridium bowmanii]|uniref:permease n=1 Tax=Clostridium bowmanii TaxID=132925 RepID=UPI001C0B94B4|nr:permease [Clostridium bowmanii]MBU3190174.1 permease [Clostridium bowmanii]MCA1074851.1 permease [Clostridium bowmanii]